VIVLRAVVPSDLPHFFRTQEDVDAARMVGMPLRDRATLEAHWARILQDPSIRLATVVADGAVAGNLMSFVRDGRREVGYWLDRAFWGRGIATAALSQFLLLERRRPLYGVVVAHNPASIAVLKKCGFVPESETREADGLVRVILCLPRMRPGGSSATRASRPGPR
jgi:RimJ/RimL family protein N-acetyltransferase